MSALFSSFRRPDQSRSHGTGFVGRHINPVLFALSRRACIHPIYTIVSVAILASTTYLGLLESSLFDRAGGPIGRVDFNSLLAGNKRLFAGPESQWKWSADETWPEAPVDNVSSRLFSAGR
jgi:hydroxymethylglutaryl-CoA reductase (NADPH)